LACTFLIREQLVPEVNIYVSFRYSRVMAWSPVRVPCYAVMIHVSRYGSEVDCKRKENGKIKFIKYGINLNI